MTEKNYNPNQKENKAMKKQEKVAQKPTEVVKAPVKESKEKKEEPKKVEVKKVKKDFAFVYGRSLPISTKKSAAICNFIRGKEIKKAIADLERVTQKKLAVPMKGEYAHQKGNVMSGGYPKKAGEYFIKMLKSLQANAVVNEVENPVIVEAVANMASRPFGQFGRVRKKRTHVQIKAGSKGVKR